MKKLSSIMLVCMAAVCCMGCNRGTEMDRELTKLEAAFREYPDTLTEQKQTDGGVTVDLHAAAFEAQRLILDYSVQAADTEDYYPRNVQIAFDSGSSESCDLFQDIYFKEDDDTFRTVEVYEWEGGSLRQQDVGSTAEVRISFLWSEKEEVVTFPVKISDIIETKRISVQKDFSYDKGTVGVEELELSPFYTILRLENDVDDAFFDEQYGFELTDENGNALMFKGGVNDSLCYGVLPADSEKAGIAVILYKKESEQNVSYDPVSDKLEIELK